MNYTAHLVAADAMLCRSRRHHNSTFDWLLLNALTQSTLSF